MAAKGSTSVLLTSEEQNARRRAVKASRRANAKKNKTSLGREPFSVGLVRDRAEQREQDREARLEETRRKSRVEQAIRAIQLLPKKDDVANTVAAKIIELFPDVTFDEGSRMQAAIRAMRAEPTLIEELKDLAGVKEGISRAYTAIQAAYQVA